MPTLTPNPIATPQEQELDQEFELDIRIETSKITQPSLNVTLHGTGCCTDATYCGTCSNETNCTYCTCNHPLC